jgi:hypothetical protein
MPAIYLCLSRFFTKCKNNCWLPTMKRRKKANQLVQSIEIRNANSSHIYRLPPELVLDIADQLQPLDKRCLRLSCRRYGLLLQDERKVKMDVYEREELKERAIRDVENERYFKLAETEILSDEVVADLLCSACHSIHPRRMFDAAEMLQSPHTRRCHGAKLGFYICPHYYITYDEIKSRMRLPGRRFGMGWDTCTRLRRYADGTWTCNGSLITTVIGGTGVLTMTDIRQHFKQLALRLCPHIHTDGIYVQQSLQEDSRQLHRVPWKWSRLPVTLVHTIIIDCFAHECEMSLEIFSHERTISTRVSRGLGTLEVPSDPRWCAQIEDIPA